MSSSQEEFDRTQEDDHDLLTFGEAGLRLRETIEELTGELLVAGEADAPKLQARLEALETAYARSQSQRIDEANYERFFGYEGRPRRNTGRQGL